MPAREEARGHSGVYVVKLGGSVLSDKSRPFSLRLNLIHRLAGVLAESLRAGAAVRGIVLGGGSYGHYTAKTCMEAGCSASEAFPLVTGAMLELAVAVADTLRGHGVPVAVYPPHSMCSPKGLKPGCHWGPAREALEAGVIPLTYGDAYVSRGRWLILSGDELSLEMACSLGASHVAYLTDVDGVIVEGEVVDRLHVDELAGLGAAGERRSGHDVTGGLARKLRAVRENLCQGLQGIWLINGLHPERLHQLLSTGSTIGTLIVP